MSSMFFETRWAGIRPPSVDDIAALARQTWTSLPDEFRTLAGEIAFSVEEFASDDTLDEVGCESAFDLMGLFVPPSGEAPAPSGKPARFVLYRRPILDFWAEQDESLGTVLAHVMVQEIGHQFGLADEDLAAIEAETRAVSGAVRTVQ